jgi:hypothetical protein
LITSGTKESADTRGALTKSGDTIKSVATSASCVSSTNSSPTTTTSFERELSFPTPYNNNI